MQSDIELQEPFSYSIILIIILFVLLLMLVGGYFLVRYLEKHKNQKKVVKIEIKRPTNIFEVKKKYLVMLEKLEYTVSQNSITNKKAYIQLSGIIRHFVYEVTNIKVTNYTLQEISTLKIPALTLLIQEYYRPEFSELEDGDVLGSIKRTRGVIEKWN